MHERSLVMLGDVFSLGRGRELFVREGRMLQTGEVLVQPGLVQTLEALAEEGAESVYRGSLAEALLGMDGVVFTAGDLRGYAARWTDPVLVDFHGHRVATRGGLSGVPELLPGFPRLAGLSAADRVLEFVKALETNELGGEHTTNMVAVDRHGRACVLTHSLGVGAGVWVPGFDLQLNNLLGESDIAFGEPRPGDHLQSRMAPSLAFDDQGLALAIGAAGATRLKMALSTVLSGILDEGLTPEDAVARPRVHPMPTLVDVEPGVDEAALEALEAQGRTVRRWEQLHHYFGGVSCVGRTGAAGDPRRNGEAIVL